MVALVGIIRLGRSARALSTAWVVSLKLGVPTNMQILPTVVRANVVILLLSGEFPFGVAMKGFKGNVAGEWEFSSSPLHW